MKRIGIFVFLLCACLSSARWAQAQRLAPQPNVKPPILHLLRRPGFPQMPSASATQHDFAGVGLAPLPAQSQTTNSTDLVRDISTDISNLDVVGSAPGLDPDSSIHTFVQSVTYGEPVKIDRGQDKLHYFEVTGTIEGIGWGGLTEDLVNLTDASNFSPYSYRVPFVLRYTKDFDGTLIVYHPSAFFFSDATSLESMFGPQGDDLRHLEREGDLYISDAVLMSKRNYAYFAFNPLIQADTSPAAIALSGPNQGQPLMVWLDVPIWRDTTQVAQRLLAKLTGNPVNLTIGTGFSGGAICAIWSNTGYSFTLDDTPYSVSYRTGGVYRTAYDQTSGKIFDGFTPYAGACQGLGNDLDCRTNPENAIGSPMTTVAGEAEVFDILMVHQAAVLQRAGADVTNSVRVYHLRTMAHNPPEAILVFPHIQAWREGVRGMSLTSGDWVEPVMAKVIDNMDAYLKTGQPLPPSLIDGTVIAGSPSYVDFPQFNRLPGSPRSELYSQVFPFVDDPSLDSVGSTVPLFSTATEADWGWSLVDDMSELRRVMPNRALDLTLPLTACRQGGFVDFLGALGFPGPFPNMKEIWGSLDNYEDCVERTMQAAVDLGVYDKEIGEEVARRTSPKALFK